MGKHAPFTTEDAQEIGRRGGIESGKARKARKDLREVCADFLAGRETRPEVLERLLESDYVNRTKKGDIAATRRDYALVAVQYSRATAESDDPLMIRESVRAAQLLADIAESHSKAKDEMIRAQLKADAERYTDDPGNTGVVVMPPVSDLETPQDAEEAQGDG